MQVGDQSRRGGAGVGEPRAAEKRMKKQDDEGTREEGTGPDSGGQSGDTQGLSDAAEAGSESA